MAGASQGGASGGAVRAGKAFVEVSAKTDQLEKAFKNIGKQFKSVGEGMAKTGAMIAAAGAAAFAPLTELMHLAIERGVEMQRAAERIGTSVESISALGYAATLSGVGMESLEGAIRKMQVGLVKMDEDGHETANALSKIGLSAHDLIDLDLDSQLNLIADGLSKVENESRKAAIVRELFGRGGAGMKNLLGGGSAGLNEMRVDALANGAIVTKEVAENAEKAHRAYERLWQAVKNTGLALGEAFLPLSDKESGAIAKIIEFGGVFRKFIKENEELFRTIKLVALGTMIAGTAIAALGGAVVALGAVFTATATVIGAVSAALGFLLSPIGLIVVGLASLTAGLAIMMSQSEGFQELIEGLGETFSKVWGGIKDALAGGDLSLAMEIAWEGVKIAFQQGVNSLKKVWIDFKTWFQNTWNDAVTAVAIILARIIDNLPEALKRQMGFSGSQQPLIDAISQSGNLENKLRLMNAEREKKGLGVDSDKLNELLALAASTGTGIGEGEGPAGLAGLSSLLSGQVKGAFASNFDARSLSFGDKTQQIVDYTKRTADGVDKLNENIKSVKMEFA